MTQITQKQALALLKSCDRDYMTARQAIFDIAGMTPLAFPITLPDTDHDEPIWE